MAEVALTNAFVVEHTDGTFRAYNCTVNATAGKLVITPDEALVSAVHLNLQKDHAVIVNFKNAAGAGATQPVSVTAKAGMMWVRRQEVQPLFSS